MNQVSRETLNRVLELVCRELGCDDARLELGGRPPEGPRAVYAELATGWRLVALFEAPPEAPHEVAVRLRHMAASFFDIGMPPAPSARPDAERHLARRRLEDELCALAGRTGASSAVVIDVTSPMLWGTSEPRGDDYDLNEARALARLYRVAREHHVDLAMVAGLNHEEIDHALGELALGGEEHRRALRLVERLVGRPLRARKAQILEAVVLGELRGEAEQAEGPPSFRRLVRRPGFGYFARSFASIYVLVLCFDGEFSELHVEGAALHALPVIERHVLALPPVEPPPRGGRVVRLPRR
ncbi:MAG: hypothetical protein GX607_07150 [Myxococcales bacterium]|nr:hypothetical protein [Myxococcales bacterium]